MPGSESIHLSAWRMLLPAALVLALAGCSKDAPTAPQDSVSTPNNAPTIASLAAIPAQVQVGRNADVVADAIDPDGDPITYEWRAELGAIFGEGSRGSLTKQTADSCWTSTTSTSRASITALIRKSTFAACRTLGSCRCTSRGTAHFPRI